jgi:hypothetical protein
LYPDAGVFKIGLKQLREYIDELLGRRIHKSHRDVEKGCCRRDIAVLEIVPASQSLHMGSPTIRRDVIDLGIVSERHGYDKLGNSLLIHQAKFYLFGSSKYRMTKKRCEEFFEDNENFVV